MKKTILVLSLIAGCPGSMQADWKTNLEYGMQTVIKPNIPAMLSGIAIATGILNRNNKNSSFALSNTPERVTEFCHKRLAYHGIDPESVCIKMIYMAPNALALYSHTILFSNSLALEFDQALANPDDAKNAAIIGRYSAILDHEIGHMKHNDVVNRLTFMAMITGAFVTAQQAIIHMGYAPWFTDKLENATLVGINNLKYRAACLVSALSFAVLSLEASNYYTRSIEISADEFAIQHAQTPSSLREMAQWLSAQEKLNLQWILITGQPLSTGFISMVRQVSLRKKLLTEYINEKYAGNSAAQNTQEFWDTFVTWVMECRPDDANFFMKTLFASADHPSADERAQRLNQAADKLEKKLLSEPIA
ncbi:MAG: M48 family metalloprotease [Candidatus Dependentiae bacterium]|nr:M48 family metalloprotease [Candidatus Dependentiae bacterium]